MLNKLNLSKDIQKYCLLYLSEDEIFYSNGEWGKFPKNNICRIAAENGWLDLLKWARKNGYYWDSWTCSDAALDGHLALLKWAKENGCDWDSLTCSYAAENGHLEVLKWARENGCDWDSLTCSY